MENLYFDPILIDGSAGDLESRSIDGSPVQGPDFEPTIIYFAPNSSSVITNVIIDRLSAKLSTDTEWWGENLTCQTLENINRQRFVFQGLHFNYISILIFLKVCFKGFESRTEMERAMLNLLQNSDSTNFYGKNQLYKVYNDHFS